MSKSTGVEELVQALRQLPADKVAEVRDFIFFLKDRYGRPNREETWDWSEDDLRELSAHVWNYAEQTVPWSEASDPRMRRD